MPTRQPQSQAGLEMGRRGGASPLWVELCQQNIVAEPTDLPVETGDKMSCQQIPITLSSSLAGCNPLFPLLCSTERRRGVNLAALERLPRLTPRDYSI